jgi:polar amino acid transport system permease protein
MITGVKITILIAVVTSVLSLVLGTLVAVMRNSRIKPLRILGKVYVEIFRNIPGLFWLLFFYFAFPEILPSYWGDKLNAYIYYPLPQTYRKVLPPLGTRMIHNFKNTSLCMAITAPELTWATQQIESITFRGLEATTIATLFYVFISLILGGTIILLERHYKIDVASITQVEAK